MERNHILWRSGVVEKFMASNASRSALILLLTISLCACGRPPETGGDNSGNSNAQKLPFDRQPRPTGVSPSQALVPSGTRLPEGTPISIRLQNALSSASSHAGDTFGATLDDAIEVDGQPLIAAGTPATGRVIEAKPASAPADPGYVRIVLVSLKVGDKTVVIYTSSIFAKGGSRDERDVRPESGNKDVRDKDVVLSTDRRLSFRLAQTVDLQ
jgi:hypothetical protein